MMHSQTAKDLLSKVAIKGYHSEMETYFMGHQLCDQVLFCSGILIITNVVCI